MCGIAGFVGFGSSADIEAMTGALAHRGPDGSGFWAAPDQPIFLGHRRLSIIDLEGGAQPMWDSAGQIGVVYNGEIYNHVELRKSLEARGHRFKTSHSDTEVLIHGYREWGDQLPGHLNGMFAFAILDRKRQRLFLARDRFGEKPLYVYRVPGRLGFASEVSAFAAHPEIETQLDARAVQKFFAWGFFPGIHTLYRNISKLRGGCWLAYEIKEDRVTTGSYWKYQLQPDEGLQETDAPRLAEELRALFAQAVTRRLISDVPLGLFLSGGIDSSAVLAATTRAVASDQIKTFTIGFNEPSYDESPYARAMAERVGTQHRTEMLDLDTARGVLPDVLGRLDQPLGDPSILPTFLLSRFTRRHVTVALSGDGGDELFAGYDPFLALGPAQIYARLVPSGLHRGLRKLVELLPKSGRNMSLDFKLRRSLSGLSWPQSMWNPIWLAPANPNDIGALFQEPVSAEDLYEEAISLWQAGPDHVVDRTLEFYANHYLQDGILCKVDRAAMLNSLESRAVFLDNDLVDFCLKLPHKFKLRHGQRKWLLKQALKDWLPEETLNRSKKGFGIPLTDWLKTMPMPNATSDLCRELGVRSDAIRNRWQSHKAGTSDERLLLFCWLAVSANGSLCKSLPMAA